MMIHLSIKVVKSIFKNHLTYACFKHLISLLKQYKLMEKKTLVQAIVVKYDGILPLCTLHFSSNLAQAIVVKHDGLVPPLHPTFPIP
jgi:hypothetical protein